jgi:hypothetical protein
MLHGAGQQVARFPTNVVGVDAERALPGPMTGDHRARAVATEATITCPDCGARARETMPENACVRAYACRGCGVTMTAKPGDCCVFCSYADIACPPKQIGDDP